MTPTLIFAMFALAATVVRMDTPSQANSATHNLQPGLWEVVTHPEFPSVPVEPQPRTDTLCLTAEDIAAGKLPLRSTPSCRVTGGTWLDRNLRLALVCEDDVPPDVVVRGSLQAQEQSFNGKIELITPKTDEGTPSGVYSYNHSAKWLGEACP